MAGLSQGIGNGTAAFLQQAYRNNWHQYLASLQPGASRGWDICVLTASDERQATMYRHQLDLRTEAGLLPTETRFLVIADPVGQRIGSGGATLRVLEQLSDQDRGLRSSARVLIIHSGGDSRRLPHCSAVGKLFARIPRALPDGRASTLFDEFLVALSGLAARLPAGVLVASGDVLLVFDHLQIGFRRPGVIGVAAAAPAETGTHHGVYVTQADHELDAYLHKPSVEQLRGWGAIAQDGTVKIDTGLVWMDAQVVRRLVDLTRHDAVSPFCGLSEGHGGSEPPVPLRTGLNLYGDVLMPLVESTRLASYLADTSDGPATPAVQAARQAIWQHLRGVPFTVECLQPAVFAHFGTSHEYWTLLADWPELRRTCGWSRHTASWLAGAEPASQERLVSINALLEGPVRVSARSALITDAQISGPLNLEGAALIAGLQAETPLTVNADLVLHQMPLQGGFVTRVFGLCDDPKRRRDDPSATYMNHPWQEWLAGAGIEPEIIWPDMPAEQQTLWNAQLYAVDVSREGSLRLSLPLQNPARAPSDWHTEWQGCRRLSLAQSFAQANGEEILAQQMDIEDAVAGRRFIEAIRAERPAKEAKLFLARTPGVASRRAPRVAEWLAADSPVLQLRGYKALSEATGETHWADRAFATLATMIAGSVPQQRGNRSQSTRAKGPPSARAQAAARIDFGGGWTDTPPYSLERGGTVLNASITLNGAYPIVAEARWLPEPRVLLESLDIGATIEPLVAGDVLACADPADPFCLLKAALCLRGLIPAGERPSTPLAQVLAERGGIHLTTQTSIPRGSGLGTSSILAGAVLAALAELVGIEVTQEQLFDEVLCLEQMMTTGGGWQDQVGGLTGGIKLVTSDPGLPQRIHLQPVSLLTKTHAALDERLLVVYTGQQRLAKNLLRAVMERWMARSPEMVWILQRIARLAVAMRDALEVGDIDDFGALVGEHWLLNKRMDPGCTNPFIDRLFEVMEPFVSGAKLAGAGGGGFAIVVARDGRAARDLSAALQERYAGTQLAVWPCSIPEQALIPIREEI